MKLSNTRCQIIAEAGVNHNGSVDLALRLVDVAAAAGADIVKFQTFNSSKLTTSNAPTAEYQKSNTGHTSQAEMLRALELSKDDYIRIFTHAKNRGIKCLSTPFDVDSLDLLVELGIDMIKIPSGEVTNGPLLLAVARKKLPMILSTGMSTLEEIEVALAVLAYGYYTNSTPSSVQECVNYWKQEGKLRAQNDRIVTILHCTTNYPASYDSINLNAMLTIKEHFGMPVGYSDHSQGILVPTVAAAMGATILEKHITLDKTMDGPDHFASLEPDELLEMVKAIHNVAIIKGSHLKEPTLAEIKNIPIVRRGLYVTKNLEHNHTITANDVAILRPTNNVSPMKYWEIIGSKTQKSMNAGDSYE